MQAAEARPPYVTFETRAVEDRAASIEAGFFKTHDVDFAVITPQGSKDRVERNVTEWFQQLEQQVAEERFEANWLAAFKARYDAWKKGQEMPTTGTSVKLWPVASPSQVKQLLDAQLRTVEDLAAANEESIGRLGMGGRSLKDKAVNWLKSAADNGKMTEEMSAMRVQLEQATDRNKALEKQLSELSAQVANLAKK